MITLIEKLLGKKHSDDRYDDTKIFNVKEKEFTIDDFKNAVVNSSKKQK